MQISELKFERVLGKGGYGEAVLYSNKKGKKFVVKSISKSKDCKKMINREIRAGETLSHKNIVKYYNHFEDTENDYLVFEYITGTI